MYTLDNGLRVILSEDHATPYAHVEVWYQVGSKDERKGRSGFAHLFEHLMFQGSEHADGEYFAPLQAYGANINGTTNRDRTNYFEKVPSHVLERALWMEADRMGHLLPALTQEKLDNQREVVRNERRQNYEMRPYAVAQKQSRGDLPLRATLTVTRRLEVMKISRLLHSTMSKASSGNGMVQITQHWWLLGTLTPLRPKLGLKSFSVVSQRLK